jgi:chemotaxis signal transduction protein
MTVLHTVVLPVGADNYAVPIDWVREVLAEPAMTRLATAPSVILGLINVRGEIVPLLDTARLLGVGSVSSVPFAAVIRTQHGPAALAVTAIPQRADLGDRVGKSELWGTAGSYELGRQVAVLLDLDALLTPEQVGGGHELRGASPPVEVGQ